MCLRRLHCVCVVCVCVASGCVVCVCGCACVVAWLFVCGAVCVYGCVVWLCGVCGCVCVVVVQRDLVREAANVDCKMYERSWFGPRSNSTSRCHGCRMSRPCDCSRRSSCLTSCCLQLHPLVAQPRFQQLPSPWPSHSPCHGLRLLRLGRAHHICPCDHARCPCHHLLVRHLQKMQL